MLQRSFAGLASAGAPLLARSFPVIGTRAAMTGAIYDRNFVGLATWLEFSDVRVVPKHHECPIWTLCPPPLQCHEVCRLVPNLGPVHAHEPGGPDWAMGTIGANPDGGIIARPRGTGVGIGQAVGSLFFE